MFAALIDDLMGQPIDVIDAALEAAKAKRDLADLEIAAITAVADSTLAYQDHGHRAVTGYLKQQLNCSASDATRLKLRGRLLNQHPDIGDLLGTSRISAGQVDLLVTAHKHPVAGKRFTEFAALLADHAEQLDYSDFAVTIKHFIAQADPDGSFDDHQFHEDHRNATVAINNGAINIHATGGDPLRAAEMKAVFDKAVNAEFDKDCATRRDLHGDDALTQPLPRTADQRRFDAIYELFMASVTAPANGRRPEPLVNIIIDPTTGIDALIRHGFLDDTSDSDGDVLVDPFNRRCATSTGTAVHPDIAIKAMIRGSIRRVFVDANDVIINMGRKQRLFTGNARQAAQLLATRCGHRGCDIPAEFCDVDHLNEWARDNGETNQVNSHILCDTHDQWKHHKRLRGRRDSSGRIHLIKPDGTVIKPLGAHDPEWPTTDNNAADTFDAPVHTTTWGEHTKNSTTPARNLIDPDTVVHIIDLRAA